MDLNVFKCSSCRDIPPGEIFECPRGHMLCDTCCAVVDECRSCKLGFYGRRQGGVIRRPLLEKILDAVQFPCPNLEAGCEEKVLRRQDWGTHIKFECFFQSATDVNNNKSDGKQSKASTPEPEGITSPSLQSTSSTVVDASPPTEPNIPVKASTPPYDGEQVSLKIKVRSIISQFEATSSQTVHQTVTPKKSKANNTKPAVESPKVEKHEAIVAATISRALDGFVPTSERIAQVEEDPSPKVSVRSIRSMFENGEFGKSDKVKKDTVGRKISGAEPVPEKVTTPDVIKNEVSPSKKLGSSSSLTGALVCTTCEWSVGSQKIYKCLQCPQDLYQCEECMEENPHAHHLFVLIQSKEVYDKLVGDGVTPILKEVVVKGIQANIKNLNLTQKEDVNFANVQCDSCHRDLSEEPQFMCVQCDDEFDLCAECVNGGKHNDTDHRLFGVARNGSERTKLGLWIKHHEPANLLR